MRSGWKKYLLYSILIIVGGSLLFGLIRLGYSAEWTGFGEYIQINPNAERGKTLWDWMELLIIPLFLAGGAFFLNRGEKELEREIAKDRQQEAALQNYLNQMTVLLLEKGLGNTENAEVRFVAKAKTLAVMRDLDGQRKGYVLKFLIDAKLVGGAIVNGMEKPPDFNLAGADLSYAVLSGINLRDISLQEINLQHADLRHAHISHTNFGKADMRYANLRGTNIHWSYFEKTNLNNANLRDVVCWDMAFKETNLQFDDLRKASFFHNAGLVD